MLAISVLAWDSGSLSLPLSFLTGDNNGKWVKHWVKGGYHYYHNLETKAGGWAEPPDFVQNSVQLSREEIQVGLLQVKNKKGGTTSSRVYPGGHSR